MSHPKLCQRLTAAQRAARRYTVAVTVAVTLPDGRRRWERLISLECQVGAMADALQIGREAYLALQREEECWNVDASEHGASGPGWGGLGR